MYNFADNNQLQHSGDDSSTFTVNDSSKHVVRQSLDRCIEPAKRQVTFAPMTRAKRTLRRTDYSREEIEATWYTSRETDAIRCEARETLHSLNHNKPLSDNECKRGLEHRTMQNGTKRQAVIDYARQVVLDEQHRQWKEGTGVDADSISHQYTLVSRQAQASAYRTGRLDHRTAR